MHYVWFVVNCFINKPQSYVKMCTSGKENNMLTDVLPFKKIKFPPHLCYKPSSLHSIVLTVPRRRVVAFALNQLKQTVWYLRYKQHTNTHTFTDHNQTNEKDVSVRHLPFDLDFHCRV